MMDLSTQVISGSFYKFAVNVSKGDVNFLSIIFRKKSIKISPCLYEQFDTDRNVHLTRENKGEYHRIYGTSFVISRSG
jgi:hypothetical protein